MIGRPGRCGSTGDCVASSGISDVLRDAGGERRTVPPRIKTPLCRQRSPAEAADAMKLSCAVPRRVRLRRRGGSHDGSTDREDVWAALAVMIGVAAAAAGTVRRRSPRPPQSRRPAVSTATAPITIVVDRKMPRRPKSSLPGVQHRWGSRAAEGPRRAAATGSVRVANGQADADRLTLERPTDKGRLLTIVTATRRSSSSACRRSRREAA